MYLKKFEPIKELTLEIIDGIKIHTTQSSLRNAVAMLDVKMVPGSESMPTLYYACEKNPESGNFEWTIHAIAGDITRYLLMHSITSADNEK